jgi:hypothetical protein
MHSDRHAGENCAGDAEGHEQFAVLEGHRRIRRQARTFARLHFGRVAWFQPRLAAARGNRQIVAITLP